MPRTVSSLLLLLVSLSFVAGCDRQPPEPGDNNGLPAFNLFIHDRLPKGDFQGVTGVQGTNGLTAIDDSVFQTLIWREGSQFRAVDSQLVPWDVWLNRSMLSRTVDPSILRLTASSDTSSRSGPATWMLLDGSDTVGVVTLPPVPLLDSIAPFPSLLLNEGIIRSDTAFTFYWGGAANAMILEWQGPNDTLVEDVVDFPGRYTLTSQKLSRVRGEGNVILTRYARVTADVQGKNIVFLRLSQRVFEGIYVQ